MPSAGVGLIPAHSDLQYRSEAIQVHINRGNTINFHPPSYENEMVFFVYGVRPQCNNMKLNTDHPNFTAHFGPLSLENKEMLL